MRCQKHIAVQKEAICVSASYIPPVAMMNVAFLPTVNLFGVPSAIPEVEGMFREGAAHHEMASGTEPALTRPSQLFCERKG